MSDEFIDGVRAQEAKHQAAVQQVRFQIESLAADIYARKVDLNGTLEQQQRLATKAMDAAFGFAGPVWNVKRIQPGEAKPPQPVVQKAE